MAKLRKPFFNRNTKTVAQDLLGKILVHEVNGQRLAGRIVETEAYVGTKDKACHAYRGRRTRRNESLYLGPGHAYVFFVYGMHFCFNTVTQKPGRPEAVLIRALEPLEGLDIMKMNRRTNVARDLTNGPSKLCQALSIDRNTDGMELRESIYIETDKRKVKPQEIVKKARVGVDYAGHCAKWKLRYYLKENNYVSKI